VRVPSRFSPLTPDSSRKSEEAGMIETILGLVVALALGAYLVVTLVNPERF